MCFAFHDENRIITVASWLRCLRKRSVLFLYVPNPAGRKTKGRLAPAHEYALFFGRSADSLPGSLTKTEKALARYPKVDENGHFAWANFIRSGSNDKREDRPKLFYPIFVHNSNTIRTPKMKWSEQASEYILLEKPSSEEVVVLPTVEKDGKLIEKNWQRGHNRVSAEPGEFRVRRTVNGEISIDFKTRMDEESLPATWWDDKKYASANYGASEMKDLFGVKIFDFAKSRYLVEDCLKTSGLGRSSALVLDFFAGSGTTGHAGINLNREDGGKRKYILVEMDYFDTVLKPRIQKVVYSKDWKDGKPVSREGVSHMFKYLRLESYEDALANLQLRQTEAQESLLKKSDSFRESYMLRYMLDTETKGSPSLLDLDQFDDPFNYKLLVGTGSVGETKPVNVDLVETFNWLLGLKVKHMDHIEGFRIVEGTNPRGEKVLVIWRKICDLSEKDLEKIQRQRENSNEDLEAFFRKQQYNTMDMEFDIIYVNGDNNLMNLPMAPEGEGLEPRYKVRLIEEEFKRLMFDVKDV